MKEISDFGLVSALITLGYSPRGRHKEGRRVIFTFDSDEELERLCEDYYNNRLDVDARRYSTTMKSVKASIYRMEDQNV